MDTVGTRIEALGATKLGKTGRQLAEALGVSYETLRKWKTGEATPSAPRQKVIAQRLGEPASVFMHGQQPVEGHPLTPDEARVLAAYRTLLKADKAKMLADAEKLAREIEELSARLLREKQPLIPPGKRQGMAA